jgi:hypothetical protein
MICFHLSPLPLGAVSVEAFDNVIRLTRRVLTGRSFAGNRPAHSFSRGRGFQQRGLGVLMTRHRAIRATRARPFPQHEVIGVPERGIGFAVDVEHRPRCQRREVFQQVLTLNIPFAECVEFSEG